MSKFIVVEGLIGVGKTSLCRLLERARGASLILEPAEDNPFLSSFYSDPTRFAFPAQMFYLHSRTLQQNRLLQPTLFGDLFVSDYIFAKDRLFAEYNLSGEEFELYKRFSSLLSQQVAKPDFVLFLDAPTELIMQRIDKRGIVSEQAIQTEYLNDLRDRYYRLWDEYTDAPVYVFDSSEVNYVEDSHDQAYMLSIIDGLLSDNPVEGSPVPYTKSTREHADLPLFSLT